MAAVGAKQAVGIILAASILVALFFGQPLLSRVRPAVAVESHVDAVPDHSLNPPPPRCVLLLVEDPKFWERDMIFNHLLRGYSNVSTMKWDHHKISLERDVAAMQATHGDCAKVPVLHCKSNKHCPVTRQFFFEIRPAIIFLLSDEFGLHECYHNLSSETAQVVLRQYSVRKYGWTEHRNVYHIVSGTQGFDGLEELERLMKPPSARKYIWSFSGGRKHDRVYMTRVLAQHLSPHKFVWHGMKPVEMVRDLYFESMFVPVGRGGQSLDCFRIYEACRAGAIPIVVGPREEIVKTFSTFLGYEERLPPCVFADTWPLAVEQVTALIANSTRLLEYHREALRFWWHSLSATQQVVHRVLGKPPY